MPALAVCSGGVDCGGSDAAKGVHTSAHWFEVVRIDATAISAEMVKLQAVRDVSDQDLV